MRFPNALLTALLLAPLAVLPAAEPIPLIDVTDLYHPHQDVGDNFDLLAAYAMPELDLEPSSWIARSHFANRSPRTPVPGWPKTPAARASRGSFRSGSSTPSSAETCRVPPFLSAA